MIRTVKRRKIYIGPEDNGRRMSLDDFDQAIGREGYLYELGKGVIEVSHVPKFNHARQFHELRDQLIRYKFEYPGIIEYLFGGAEAKLLIGPSESERHPDLMVYCSPGPEMDNPWSLWVPEIVIEIVSESSRKRDYEVKPDEYLEFGVSEYWIIDAAKGCMTAMIRWRGQWKTQIIKPNQKHTTRLLPKFTLNLKRILAAAKVKPDNGSRRS